MQLNIFSAALTSMLFIGPGYIVGFSTDTNDMLSSFGTQIPSIIKAGQEFNQQNPQAVQDASDMGSKFFRENPKAFEEAGNMGFDFFSQHPELLGEAGQASKLVAEGASSTQKAPKKDDEESTVSSIKPLKEEVPNNVTEEGQKPDLLLNMAKLDTNSTTPEVTKVSINSTKTNITLPTSTNATSSSPTKNATNSSKSSESKLPKGSSSIDSSDATIANVQSLISLSSICLVIYHMLH